MNKYTISDIHGCLQTFKALLKQINFNKNDELYLLGDYVDRGPDSKGVFDLIWELQQEGYQVHCLRGNHEQLLLDSFQSTEKDLMWKRNGGVQTLASFIKDGHTSIPRNYIHFIEELPYYFEVDQYILVHAGLNFDVPNPLEAQHSMMWIRKWYDQIVPSWLGDRIIVHGHTPTQKSEIELMHSRLDQLPVLDIDGGCVYERYGMGYLCAFELTRQQLYFQRNQDIVVYN